VPSLWRELQRLQVDDFDANLYPMTANHFQLARVSGQPVTDAEILADWGWKTSRIKRGTEVVLEGEEIRNEIDTK
jgi:hypothetical protein